MRTDRNNIEKVFLPAQTLSCHYHRVYIMAEKKRILIPGGAGYIGSHVVLCVLLTRRYKVTGMSNLCRLPCPS